MKFSNTVTSALATAVFGFLALGLTSVPAVAATAVTAPGFTVSATVQATCSITATALIFGTYTGVQLDGTSALSVTCTNTTPYDVGLNKGLNGASETARQMKIGATTNVLNYALFSDTTRGTNWGNATGTWVHGAGIGSSQSMTVYGRIAASQFVTPGDYTDTIVATVNY